LAADQFAIHLAIFCLRRRLPASEKLLLYEKHMELRNPKYSFGRAGASVHASTSKAPRQRVEQHRGQGEYHVPRSLSWSSTHPGHSHKMIDMKAVTVSGSEDLPSVKWAHRLQGYSFGGESRMTEEGIMKGLVRRSGTKLGPCDYTEPAASLTKRRQPAHSVPSAKEAAEQIRLRHSQWSPLGPGQYNACPTPLEVVTRELDGAGDTLPASMKQCHWTSQFNHMFASMKSARMGHVRGANTLLRLTDPSANSHRGPPPSLSPLVAGSSSLQQADLPLSATMSSCKSSPDLARSCKSSPDLARTLGG